MPQRILKARIHAGIQWWESTAPDRESLLHIPQREYHRHMTRVPLTLGHLACCLPLQPLHTENACACVCLHVSWTATFNTLLYPHTKRNHREEKEWEKQKKKKEEWWGHQNTLVSNGYATYETNWFMGGFFVREGTTPFLPSRLCQPLHHPGTQASSLSFSKEGGKKKKKHLVLLNFQHRSRQSSASW